jgi:hypothetical protein
LYFFNKYNKDWSSGLHRNFVYELIRDRFLRSPRNYYPTDDIKDVEKYSRRLPEWRGEKAEKHRKQDYFAHILILLVDQIRKGRGATVNKNSQDRETAVLIRRVSHIDSIPNLEDEYIEFPTMDFGSEEQSLEPYNRAWNLLKYFARSIQTSIWKRYQNDAWARSSEVDHQYYPYWMRPDENLPLAETAEALKQVPALPIKLQWNKGGSKADREKLEEHFDYVDKEPKSEKIDATGDPRFHSAGQFRDTIRQDFNCQKLQLQIRSASMIIPSARATTDEEPDSRRIDLMDVDWDKVKEAVGRSFAEGEEILVRVQFNPLDTEDDEQLMESYEAPQQIAHLLRQGDE